MSCRFSYMLLIATAVVAVGLEAALAQSPLAVATPTTRNAATAIPSGVFEPAQIIAVVGDQPILAGDLLGTINQALEPYEGKAPKEEIEKQRRLLMQRLLGMAVETKLVYLDFLREIPAENLPEVQAQLDSQFQQGRLAGLVEQAEVANAVELDAKLRQYGSSVAKQRQIFAEQVVAQQLLIRKVDSKPEVTHQEMLDHYRAHEADYAVPGKARWQALSVRFDKFPSQAEAYRVLANMGNEVLRGAPFDAVAKRHSQGINAGQGGYHDWTSQGSLASDVLDQAIFTLPIGRLSPILKDQKGFHIVKVLDRQNADRVPFVEAQVEIKKTISQEKVAKGRLAYLQALRDKTLVWTIFDVQAGNESPPRR